VTSSKPSAAGVTFSIKVMPRASKNQIVGREGDSVKVRLNAPPVDGKANDALVKFLAASFGVSLRQVEIVAGATSRHKVVRITGVTANHLEELIPK
jgi:uncharacterized protein